MFLIQNTQNRDSTAIQFTLNELIRATSGAHNALLDLEELTWNELNGFLKVYRRLAAEGRKRADDARDRDASRVAVRQRDAHA